MAQSESSRALRAGRDLMLSAVVFGAGVNVLYLAPSLYMLQVYDRVLQTGALLSLALVSAILLFALATLALLDAARAGLMGRLSLRLDRLLAPRLLDAVMRRDSRNAEAQRRQALRAFDAVRQTIAGPAMLAVMDAPWTPIYVVVAFLIPPLIGLLALGGGAILVAIAIANDRAMRARTARSLAIAMATRMAPPPSASRPISGWIRNATTI